MLNLWHICITCPCIVLNLWHFGVISPYSVLLYVNSYVISVTAFVIKLVTIYSSFLCVMVHVNVCVWIIQNVTICWSLLQKVSAVYTLLFCSMVSMVLLNCHLYMPEMLCVSQDYSTHLFHSHLVGSPSVVISVAFHYQPMPQRTPIFPLDQYCRSYRN